MVKRDNNHDTGMQVNCCRAGNREHFFSVDGAAIGGVIKSSPKKSSQCHGYMYSDMVPVTIAFMHLQSLEGLPA